MSPSVWDGFIIYVGATLNQVIKWSDTCGTPIDLTGYTAKLEARYKLDDVSPFITLTTSNGGIVIDALNGKITLNMTATATALLVAGKGVYDMQMINGSTKSYLLQGAITVQKMVTT